MFANKALYIQHSPSGNKWNIRYLHKTELENIGIFESYFLFIKPLLLLLLTFTSKPPIILYNAFHLLITSFNICIINVSLQGLVLIKRSNFSIKFESNWNCNCIQLELVLFQHVMCLTIKWTYSMQHYVQRGLNNVEMFLLK